MNKNTVVMVMVILALLGSSCAQDDSKEVNPQEENYTDDGDDKSDDPFGQALDQYKAGNYEQAIELGTQAIEVYREEGNKAKAATALLLTGLSKEKLGDYAGAVTDYYKLLDEKADDPQLNLSAYKNIAVLYKKFRRYDEALLHNEEALKIARESLPNKAPDILYNMGNIYLEDGSTQEAMALYEQALEGYLNMNDFACASDARNRLGMVLKDQGKFQEARTYYQEILETKEKLGDQYALYSGRAYHNTGVTYMDEGKLDEAIKYFKKALEQKKGGNPESLFISYLDLGDCYARKGKTEAAIAEWETALTYYPNPVIPDHFIIFNHLAKAQNAQKNQSARSDHLSKYSTSWEVYEATSKELDNQNAAYEFNATIENLKQAKTAAETSTTDLYQNIAIVLLLALAIGAPIRAAKVSGKRAKEELAKEIMEILKSHGISF